MEDRPRPSKSRDGMPAPVSPRGVNLAAEARRSRLGLYPTTLAYGAAGVALVLRAVAAAAPWTASLFGVLAFTGVEYFVHRDLLHGRFPDGPGPLRRFLHRRLDHLHSVHHLRPWDGAHMHGALRDTLPAVLPLALAAATLGGGCAAFLGALLLAYVAEEWTHHALHYGRSQLAPLVYLRRRHFLHHSPRGDGRVFGLTSGLWDAMCGTSALWTRRGRG
jgi:sterol desaturase/sphingolipid hydroxylase (fatty acid hydroxylase superfamily)